MGGTHVQHLLALNRKETETLVRALDLFTLDDLEVTVYPLFRGLFRTLQSAPPTYRHLPSQLYAWARWTYYERLRDMPYKHHLQSNNFICTAPPMSSNAFPNPLHGPISCISSIDLPISLMAHMEKKDDRSQSDLPYT
ncbi:hypothetical protein GE09DRAFT_1056787 [Coniochaeta sp. 2T2.1]|nr:hypothetical protein GE09DRAFT_1056787 [Coniochaeta sp. 2T2.1]